MNRNLAHYLNLKVNELIVGVNVKGDKFGIEIELEGSKVKCEPGRMDILTLWSPVNDPSLRDIHGESQEWVFTKPLNYDQSCKAVYKLFDYLNSRKAVIIPSQRTSVHVHFNMSDKRVYQVYNTYVLFTIFEDILSRFCGEDRQGNLNCLETRGATYILKMVENSLLYNNFNDFSKDLRYAALSLCSLHKFGTVEFRGMRGLDNPVDVNNWLSIINDLTQYSCYKMKNPMELMNEVSMETPYEFMKKIFSPENFNLLTQGLSRDEISNSIYEGLRLTQYLANIISSVWPLIVPAGAEEWWGKPEEEEEEKVGNNLNPPFPRPVRALNPLLRPNINNLWVIRDELDEEDI